MTIDPTVATASEIASAIGRREISSVEVLDALLARIDQANGVINAVVALDAEGARVACLAADEQTLAAADPAELPPLHGLPMTIKDAWDTVGLPSTCGVVELAGRMPGEDALAVARLRNAGAIVFGKTNTPAWAGDMQTDNEVYGLTRNPWDPERTTSGSSGGAAAALAAGFTPLELGTDIGGSIRTPSASCGVYGLKPSWGVVPSRGYLPPYPGLLVDTDVNCGGPMARSVQDLLLALGIIAGPTPEAATGWRLELPDDGIEGSFALPETWAGSRPLTGLRIALTVNDDRFPVATEVQDALRRFAGGLEQLGATLVEAPLPVPLVDAFRTWQDLVIPQVGATLPDDAFAIFAGLDGIDAGDDLTIRSGQGLALRWRDVLAAQQRAEVQRRAWAAHFRSHDLVLCPAWPVVAFPHDVDRELLLRTVDVDGTAVPHIELTAWPGGIGAMHLPVVVLPTGRSASSGLPVGVQVIGPYLRDRWLLRTCHLIDALTPDAFALPPR